MADAKAKLISLVGPPNTASFLEATRYYIGRFDLDLNVTEFSKTGEEFKDGDVKFIPIVLSVPTQKKDTAHPAGYTVKSGEKSLRKTSSIVRDETSENLFRMKLCPQQSHNPDSDPKDAEKYLYTYDKRPHKRLVHPRSSTSPYSFSQGGSPSCEPVKEDISICYAIHTPDFPGKFDPQKAKALGVPQGKPFGDLSRGLSVTTPSGAVVHPNQVISPSVPGLIVLVIDCPSLQHLSILASSPEFNGYVQHKSQIKLIVHMTPMEILSSSTYTELFAKFGDDAQHIILNGECPKHLIFTSWSTNQFRLNNLHSRIFPLPHYTTTPSPLYHSPIAKSVLAEPLVTFVLAPLNKLGFEAESALAPLDPNVALELITSNKELEDLINSTKAAVNSLPSTPTTTSTQMKSGSTTTATTSDTEDVQELQDFNKETELVFLGTGASLPSKYRNVTSNYIHVPEYGNILLDCGEGSLGQLWRKYGPALEDEILNTKLIFISHIHADHHLGLIRVLTRRQELVAGLLKEGKETDIPKPPLVVAPSVVYNWLCEYSELEHLDFEFINTDSLLFAPGKTNEILPDLLLDTVLVEHCPDAYGAVVTHKTKGWKIVFSGDTRPCEALAIAGADIVIHEATFEDDKQRDAEEKAHATTSEAVETGLRMNAKFTLLNHFSQRYPKIPTFNESHIHCAAVAFDLMSITLKDFAALSLLYPALKAIFQEVVKGEEKDEAEDETTEKTQKRKSAGEGESLSKKPRK